MKLRTSTGEDPRTGDGDPTADPAQLTTPVELRTGNERPETRHSLVLAAVETFSRTAYESVTIRDIERMAGVNRGLAAYHFKTKDALWQAALEWLMGDWEAEWKRFREFLPLVSPDERARVLIRVYVHFVAKHPEFFRLLVIEGGPSERAKILIDRYLRPWLAYFRQATGTEGGSPEQAAIDCFTFAGAASMIFAAPTQCELLFGVDPATDEFIELFAHQMANRGYGRSTAAQADDTPGNTAAANSDSVADPSLPTSDETLPVEEPTSLTARSESAGHVGYEHE